MPRRKKVLLVLAELGKSCTFARRLLSKDPSRALSKRVNSPHHWPERTVRESLDKMRNKLGRNKQK